MPVSAIKTTIHEPPMLSGRLITWTAVADTNCEVVSIPLYKRATVAISGDFSKARVTFLGSVASTDEPVPLSLDGAFPFVVTKPCVIQLPVAVARLAPVVSGGTDETKLTISTFISAV